MVGLAEGSLTPDEQSAVERHLDDCSDCRRMLASLARVMPPRGSCGDEAAPPTLITSRPPRLPEVGEILAKRFRLEQILGYGAMGVVYEAVDEALDSKVAIKVLRPDLAGKADLLKQIRREVQIGRRINHPNVCRLFDFGSDGELQFLVQELIVGESLQAQIGRKAVAEASVAPLLKQICAGLAAAHREKIVHRDLKPANIMIDVSGRAVVMDFGLAADVTLRELSIHGPVGTPAFWAPEQARGERATSASDVWALGAIAYLLITGRRFAAGAPQSLLEVPARWRKFVAGCLGADARQRFPSAVAAFEALEGTSATAPAPGPPRPRRYASLFASVACTTFALVIAARLVLRGAGEPPQSLREGQLLSGASEPKQLDEPQVRRELGRLEELSHARVPPLPQVEEALREARELLAAGAWAPAWAKLQEANIQLATRRP